MAIPDEINSNPIEKAAVADESGKSGGAYLEEEEEEEEDEEEEVEESQPPEPQTRLSQVRMERKNLEKLVRRLETESITVRVHDVIIKGNTKTKDSLLEAETAPLKDATTMQELLQASQIVNHRLQSLDIFDSVRITLDSGPAELPGTANVIVEVKETGRWYAIDAGAYHRFEARTSTVEGSLRFKNILGYGDLWDGSMAYGCDHRMEFSAGLHLPRFKGTPVDARAFLLTQDWMKLSSFKEQSLGLNLNLFSNRYHEMAYTLAWRTLTDPSQMASQLIRRQLGHGLLSSLKYTFNLDYRNSTLRPTRGYAFRSTSQIGGLAPDSVKFLRQEFDLRFALPLGFYRSALNFGISSGVVFPWGPGFSNMPSPLPERFFLGGNMSPLGTLGGPTALWGFHSRGLGPTAPRRQMPNSDPNVDPGRDYVGGDLAVTAFADLSFDLPLKWCRDKGIHGHIFGSVGNVEKLTENAYKSFALKKFVESFRSCIGAGIVLPTNFFRLELNYCYMLKKHEYDRAKSGFKMSFSI